MAYEVLADIYDAFNEDADYCLLHSYILSQLEQAGISKQGSILADLGCGTGDLTLMLLEDGYDMIGIDASEEMLCILREKAAVNDSALLDDWCSTQEASANASLLLLCQDLRKLDLYGTVDAMISSFDTLNHIGPYSELKRAMTRSALFLRPGGIFVFDMNTLYKHEQILANNTFEMEAEDVTCEWRNEYVPHERRTKMTVCVCDKETGLAQAELFSEYAYTKDEILQAMQQAGLDTVEWCDAETLGPVCATTQRFLITAVKRSDINCNREYQAEECVNGQADTGNF